MVHKIIPIQKLIKHVISVAYLLLFVQCNNAELSDIIEELKGQLTSTDTYNKAEHNRAKQELQQHIDGLNTQLNTVATTGQLQQHIDGLNTRFGTVATTGQLQQHIAELNTQIDGLNTQLKTLATTDQLQQHIAGLNTQLKTLATTDQLQQHIDGLNTQLKTLATTDQLQQHIDGLNTQFATVTTTEDLQEQIVGLTDQIKHLDHDILPILGLMELVNKDINKQCLDFIDFEKKGDSSLDLLKKKLEECKININKEHWADLTKMYNLIHAAHKERSSPIPTTVFTGGSSNAKTGS